jgi:hypothetical protein
MTKDNENCEKKDFCNAVLFDNDSNIINWSFNWLIMCINQKDEFDVGNQNVYLKLIIFIINYLLLKSMIFIASIKKCFQYYKEK